MTWLTAFSLLSLLAGSVLLWRLYIVASKGNTKTTESLPTASTELKTK
jgi:hypothetical protein